MQLHNVQDEAAETDTEHEVEENGFLRSARHEAVRFGWAGVGLTAEKVRDFKSKQVILANEKDYLHDGAQQNVDDVDEQHLAGELRWVLPHLSHFLVQLAPLLTLILLGAPLLVGIHSVVRSTRFKRRFLISSHAFLPLKWSGSPGHDNNLLDVQVFILCDFLQDVDNVEDGGRWDEHNLEDPEAQVWDRSKGVVADVITSRLQGVAGKLWLLVAVHGIPHQGHQQDAEDEEHCQPYLADDGGMVLNLR